MSTLETSTRASIKRVAFHSLSLFARCWYSQMTKKVPLTAVWCLPLFPSGIWRHTKRTVLGRTGNLSQSPAK